MTRVGIVGATGAVGRQMLECLLEREYRKEDIRLFASERSVGKTIPYGNEQLVCEKVEEGCFDGLDFVLGAVSNALSKEYAPMIKKAGAVYIDNSSAFRLEEDVPLVVPEINGADALNHHGIIANPNCSTIIAMMAIAPIHALSPVEAIVASTYQAVSGAGMGGIAELSEQVEAVRSGKPVQASVFPSQIAYNCIASIGSMTDNGYTTEEMKMQNEGRRLLHNKDLMVSCTCVRVPVFRSHSVSVSLVTKDKLDLDEVRKAISAFDGDVLVEDHVPTPLETSNQDKVYVGRIRRDLLSEKGISLWCCGDQIRKGAASNAVEIMDYMLQHA